MNNYMKLICTRPQDISAYQSQQNNKEQKQKNQNQSQKAQLNPVEQQKKKYYQDKVRSITSFDIGQKLPMSFELHSETEMQKKSFTFRNSAHFRVLTKWCEQLYKKFDDDYIMKRQFPFRMKDESQCYLDENEKKLLCVLLALQKQQIEVKLKKINESNFYMQSKISRLDINQNLQMFLRDEAMVGQFATGVYKCYQNYLINYLNILIHSLNTVSKNFMNIQTYIKFSPKLNGKQILIQDFIEIFKDKNQFKKQIKQCQQKISSINQEQKQQVIQKVTQKTPQLISFNIGDLIRCKFTSKEYQILTIYYSLENDPDIKIVRVKNRLDGGNRDVLINALFKNQVMTEIQLCIKSDKSKFIECSNQFNHFIYELQRAKFGPISEMANLWINYDKRADHFMRKIDMMFGSSTKISKKYEIQDSQHVCCQNKKQGTISLAFQCSSCQCHYFDVNKSDGNTFCVSCKRSLCFKCNFNVKKSMEAQFKNLKQQITKITAIKQKDTLFLPSEQKNFVFFNLKQKNTKARPFRVIKDSNKIHLFEKITQYYYEKLNLIATFKKNEQSEKQIHKFLNENLVIQVEGLPQLTPQFGLEDVLSDYFYPKLFKQIYKKEKNNIFMRGKQLKDHNIPNSQIFDKIKSIDFEQNELTDINLIIKTFTNIQYANLTKNKISIISKDIFELPELQILNLNNNSIIKLPQKIQRSQLISLNLSLNQIEGISNEFFNFKKLRKLDLQNNMIKTLPQKRPNMNCLVQFDLQYNQIEEIPNEFFNFEKLRKLNLHKNKIVKLPQNRPNMNNLEQLYLYQNQIEEIPNEFFNFDPLRILKLSQNKIKTLPQSRPNMNCLEQFDLQKNQIEEIPNEFFNFDKLRKLYLQENKIKTLPQNRPNIDCLEQLSLSDNKISIIPSSFFLFNKLTYLNLLRNPITTFEQIVISPKLQKLSIDQNQLDEISKNNLLKLKNNGLQISNQ